jgi:DNA-binding transcriptional LysR family regulator
MRLYAAPSYIARFGSPASIADLDHHRIVTFGTPVPAYLQDLNWLETAGRTADNPRAPTVKINNVFALKNAVARGIGIAVLPNYMVEPDSGLIQVLPDTPVPSFATYFTYPAELKNSARVRVFRDFILSKAQTWSY